MDGQVLVWNEMRRWYREDAAVPLANRVAMWAAFAALFALAGIDHLTMGTWIIIGVAETAWSGLLVAGIVDDYLSAKRRLEDDRG